MSSYISGMNMKIFHYELRQFLDNLSLQVAFSQPCYEYGGKNLGWNCRNKKAHAESYRRMLFDIEGNGAHGGLPLICSLVHMSSHADCIRGIDLTMRDPRAPFVYAATG